MRDGTRRTWWAGRSRVMGRALVVVSAMLALAGCATGGVAPTGHGKAPPAPPVVATAPAPAELPPASMAQAWGNVTVHALPTDLGNGRIFGFSGNATPDGQWLVGTNAPRATQPNPAGPSYAVLYNINTRQVLSLRQLAQPNSMIFSAVADANWVVWVEGLGNQQNPALVDWVIYAYNRQTSQVKQIAQEGSGTTGPSLVALDKGHLLWTVATGPIDATHTTNWAVREDDLATGGVTILANGAFGEAIAWPWAAWRAASQDATGYAQMTVKNLVSGQTVQFPMAPGSVALSGNSVAYNENNGIYVIDDAARGQASAQMVAPYLDPSGASTQSSATNNLQYATLNDRIVAWDADLSAQVYDRVARRLVNLPTTNPSLSYSTWAAGRLLVWDDAEPQAQQDQDKAAHLLPLSTLDVIDTTTLPAQ